MGAWPRMHWSILVPRMRAYRTLDVNKGSPALRSYKHRNQSCICGRRSRTRRGTGSGVFYTRRAAWALVMVQLDHRWEFWAGFRKFHVAREGFWNSGCSLCAARRRVWGGLAIGTYAYYRPCHRIL
ncbi:hypothetical protein IEO21_06357 [Rhodonia placenta]|uniref:Uncharacterized protein n=1 Tax=Rhodonia placenta TaxID=104341 RepID=A0A8H7U0P5_9APHY|nr:hypothetical protein IEO21_06357 [Postia placenta]